MTPDRFVKISGQRVKSYRDAHGLSQVDVAADVGITARALRKIEHGDAVNVRRTNLGKFAGALNMSLDRFLEQFAVTSPVSIIALADFHILKVGDLDKLLDGIIAERQSRQLPPLPEHVEAAVLRRAAKPMPRRNS